MGRKETDKAFEKSSNVMLKNGTVLAWVNIEWLWDPNRRGSEGHPVAHRQPV